MLSKMYLDVTSRAHNATAMIDLLILHSVSIKLIM